MSTLSSARSPATLRAVATACLLACSMLRPGTVFAQDGARVGEAGAVGEREAEAIQVTRAVLHAINTADSALARSLMLPDAQLIAVAVGGPGGEAVDTPAVRSMTVDQFVAMVSEPGQGFVERLWAPEVRVQGPLAIVWAPYDFYIHGAFSHCGVDTVQLVRTADGWKVKGLAYTVEQPPACALHPEGPPIQG